MKDKEIRKINLKSIVKIITCIVIFYILSEKNIYAISVDYAKYMHFQDNLWKIFAVLIIIALVSLAYIIAIIIEKQKLLHRLKNFSIILGAVMITFYLFVGIKYYILFSNYKYFIPVCFFMALLIISVLVQLCNIKCKTKNSKKIIICFSIVSIISIGCIFALGIDCNNRLENDYNNNKHYTGLYIDKEIFKNK